MTIKFYLIQPVARRDDGEVVPDETKSITCKTEDAAERCARQLVCRPGYVGCWICTVGTAEDGRSEVTRRFLPSTLSN